MPGVGVLDGTSTVRHLGQGKPRNRLEIRRLGSSRLSLAWMPGELPAILSGLRAGGGAR
jgi:hypothetical protein